MIPARDRSTLQPSGHYFLLFPNPAYARAYQSHVVALHRISRTYTPTSVESPMSPPEGVVLEGKDVYAMIQNYSLCPPSQQISLKVIFPPYSSSMKRLLDQRGYPQTAKSENQTCNSVLFWTDGLQLTLHEVHKMIRQDGRYRGLTWNLKSGNKSIEKVRNSSPDIEESGKSHLFQDTESLQQRPSYPRYIITFVNENEARRFVRGWHRKPFPIYAEKFSLGESSPLIHAEILW